jgi:hypothetical protein
MSKIERINKRIKKIESRFKTKVSKGRKGTDMDIERHERRIEKLRGKHREETIKQERNMPESPLGFTMPHNIIKGVKNIVDTAIDTHWKSEEDAWRKSGKGNVPSSAYAVYDRGRRTKFGPGQGKGDQGPKGAFEYDTPRLRTKYEDNPGDNKTHSYMSWKNRNK